MDNELIQIYLERKNKYLELFSEGKSWEQAREIIDKMDFEERILKICPPVKKKFIILTKSYYEHPENYPKYDNYDAIEVSRVENIPYDYEGIMGVPITFLSARDRIFSLCQTKPKSEKFCLKITQFEIIGSADADIVPIEWKGMSKEFVELYYKQGNTGSYKEGNRLACFIDYNNKAKVPFKRILIKKVF